MRTQTAVVMASGRGSNFKAIADAIEQNRLPHLKILALISNKSEAGALEIAKEKSIPFYVLESKPNRKQFEADLLNVLLNLNPDWILLAGFMLILKKELIQRFPNRIINIHPSLLPKFRGTHAQRQALESGEKLTGCSVHFVTEELDSGPIILQRSLEIYPSDTEESLSERLLPLEHATYIEALRLLTTGKILRHIPDHHQQ